MMRIGNKVTTRWKKISTVLVLIALVFGSLPVEPIFASLLQTEPIVYEEIQGEEVYEEDIVEDEDFADENLDEEAVVDEPVVEEVADVNVSDENNDDAVEQEVGDRDLLTAIYDRFVPSMSGTGQVRIAWGSLLPNDVVIAPENNEPITIPLMVIFTPERRVYEAGSLEIRIPRFLVQGRDAFGGTFPRGEITQGLEANPTFSWTIEGDEVILTNHSPISSAGGNPIVISGIQYTFSPSHLESGFEHTVTISAFYNGDEEEVEPLHARSGRVELIADGELTIAVETRITPNQNDKDVESGWSNTVEWNHAWGSMPTHLEWDADWGEIPDLTWEGINPSDIVDGFFYVNWRVDVGHVNGFSRYGDTTMPWEGHITELPGENGRIVAYQINGGAWRQDNIEEHYNPDTGNYYGIWPWDRLEVGTNSPYDIDSGDANGTRTINVIMAFPLIPTGSGFAYSNCVIWDVRGIDSEMSLQEVVDADEADAVEIVWPGDGYLQANARILRFADHAYRLDPCGPGDPRFWNPALEGDFPFTKEVQAEDDENWEDSIVIEHGDYYTYRLRWENRSNAPVYSLVIFDVFETAEDSEWQGDFRGGIRVNVPGPALATPYRIYYSTYEYIDPRGNVAHADLSDASLWTLSTDFDYDYLEDVTAVAVYFGTQRFGTTQPGSVVYVEIDMRAPASGHANETARNNGSWRGDASHPEIADEIPVVGETPETEVRIERDGTIIEGDCEGISLGNVVDEEHNNTIPGVTVAPELDENNDETGRMIVVVPGNRNPDNVTSTGPGWTIVGTPEVDEDGYMTIILAPTPDPYCDPVVITVDCDGIEQITIAGVVIDHENDDRVIISGPYPDGSRIVRVPGSRPNLVTVGGPGYNGNVAPEYGLEWNDSVDDYVDVRIGVIVTLTPNPDELFCLDIIIEVDCYGVLDVVDENGEPVPGWSADPQHPDADRDENIEIIIPGVNGRPIVDIGNDFSVSGPGWDIQDGSPRLEVIEEEGTGNVLITLIPEDDVYCEPIIIEVDCDGVLDVTTEAGDPVPGWNDDEDEPEEGQITVTIPGVNPDEITVNGPGWIIVGTPEADEDGLVTVILAPDPEALICLDIIIEVDCDGVIDVEDEHGVSVPGWNAEEDEPEEGQITVTIPGVDPDNITVDGPGWSVVGTPEADEDGLVTVVLQPEDDIFCELIIIEVDCDEVTDVVDSDGDSVPGWNQEPEMEFDEEDYVPTGNIVVTIPGVDPDNITVTGPGWSIVGTPEADEDGLVTVVLQPEDDIYCSLVLVEVDCDNETTIIIDGEDVTEDGNVVIDEDGNIIITLPEGVNPDNVVVNVPDDWVYEITVDEDGRVVIIITPGICEEDPVPPLPEDPTPPVEEDPELPQTGTALMNMLKVGVVLASVGAVVAVVKKKKQEA